jgi:hypothetical protein
MSDSPFLSWYVLEDLKYWTSSKKSELRSRRSGDMVAEQTGRGGKMTTLINILTVVATIGILYFCLTLTAWIPVQEKVKPK